MPALALAAASAAGLAVLLWAISRAVTAVAATVPPGSSGPSRQCLAGRLHSPYIQWTRTVNGKTVTRLLTPAQYQAYAPWLASTRRLRALAAELEALSLQEMARAEGWATITPSTQAPARTQARPRPETARTTQNAGRPARLTREQPTAEHP